MGEQTNVIQRFRDLRCYPIDGMYFYRLRDVFDALGMSTAESTRKRASARIGSVHKRYLWQKKRTRSGKLYAEKRFCYIDRTGVESLVLRYGGCVPRWKLMAALPEMP